MTDYMGSVKDNLGTPHRTCQDYVMTCIARPLRDITVNMLSGRAFVAMFKLLVLPWYCILICNYHTEEGSKPCDNCTRPSKVIKYKFLTAHQHNWATVLLLH